MNLYNLVLEQFNSSLEKISHDKNILMYLSEPKHEIITNFPVRMDSGDIQMFRGYRVQHNNTLAHTKEESVLVWMYILMK